MSHNSTIPEDITVTGPDVHEKRILEIRDVAYHTALKYKNLTERRGDSGAYRHRNGLRQRWRPSRK